MESIDVNPEWNRIALEEAARSIPNSPDAPRQWSRDLCCEVSRGKSNGTVTRQQVRMRGSFRTRPSAPTSV